MSEQLKQEIAVLDDALRAYEQDIQKLQNRLREARSRQTAIAARLESAENRVKLRSLMTNERVDDALSRFDQLERRVDYAEGRADALNIADKSDKPSLSDEIAALEGSRQDRRRTRTDEKGARQGQRRQGRMPEPWKRFLSIVAIFIGLPWIILHYITKWKTSATITNDDEALLEELYNLAKRLDDRMDTVERLVASDNPEFRPARLVHDSEQDNQQLRELEQLIAEKKGKPDEHPPHHALPRQAEREADGCMLRHRGLYRRQCLLVRLGFLGLTFMTGGSTIPFYFMAGLLLNKKPRISMSTAKSRPTGSACGRTPAYRARNPRPDEATSTAAWPKWKPSTSATTRG